MSKRGLLEFSMEDLRARHGLAVALSVPASELFPEPPADAKLAGPVAANVEFLVGGDSILLQAELSGEWIVPCNRCLAEHRTRFDARAEETYPLSAPSVDAADALRQAALLEIPSRSLCRPDCKGLCPHCGADLNARSCGCATQTPGPLAGLNVLKKKKGKKKT